MPTCPYCSEIVTSTDDPQHRCPGNQADLRQAPSSCDEPWKSTAKVASLAEAGYLVSRLSAEGIEGRIVESESFSAIAGTWSNSYLLQVPADSYDAAAEILRDEAEAIRTEEPDYNDFGEPLANEPVHLVFWRPVALMAVAGLATLWLGQRVADPRPRLGPHRNAAALGAAVESVGQPFEVRTETGQLQHRLRFRPAKQTWYLESDTNGDGMLDHQRRFVLDDQK